MRSLVLWALMLAPLAACHKSQGNLTQACFGRDAKIAIASCSEVIASRRYSGPKLSLLHVAKAENELHARDNQAALADLNQAVAIEGGNALAYYHRSYAYRALHDQEHALSDLNRTLDLDPGNTRYLFARGELFLSERRTGDAIADYDQILARSSSDLRALQMKAAAYSLAGEPEKALQQINAVLLIAPNLAEGFAARCLYRGTAKIDASLALADCDSAVAMKPRTPNSGRRALESDLNWVKPKGRWQMRMQPFNWTRISKWQCMSWHCSSRNRGMLQDLKPALQPLIHGSRKSGSIRPSRNSAPVI
jgi:tetratricopeptide (TPR) repeat protein